jgi:hypothetical protein
MEAQGAGHLSGSASVRLLCDLCETVPPEVSGQHIAEAAQSIAVQELIEAGSLVEIGASASILCFACDEPHQLAVEHCGDGRYRAYCVATGYQDVPSHSLRRYRVDEQWIARTIAASLGLSARYSHAKTAVCISVGMPRLGRYRCHLFFASMLSQPGRLIQAKQQVESVLGNAPGILITSTPRDLIPGDAPARCAFVHLGSILALEKGRPHLCEDPLHAALRGPQPSEQPLGFSFSSDYRSGRVGDQEYLFSPKQALAVESLHRAWKRARPGRQHHTVIREAADSSQTMAQLFRHNPAYGTLIQNDGTGFYWLDL